MSIPRRPGFLQEKDGPGLTLILVILVVVAVVGAKYFGFTPGKLIAPQKGNQKQAAATAPLVVVYTAHPTENYTPNAAHAKGAGDIVEVAQSLQEALQAQALRAKVVTDIQVASWSQAFQVARSAIQPLISEEKGLAAVLDIHRDAIDNKPDGYTTVMIDQKPVAKILLIVGDVENPNVEQNLAFAEAVRAQLEALAPGISRGVKVLHEPINGDLHPQSVQVYIGDYSDNTVEEAQAAVAILAQAVAKALQQQAN